MAHPLQPAGLPAELYKFRPFSSEKDWSRVREILVENKLFFATPKDFNDPFDPRPLYKYESREKFLHEYIKKARAGVRDKRLADERERQLLRADLSKLVESVTQQQHIELRDRFQILSLTGTREPILLWSHYASKHTGLCIHFDATAFPFNVATQVRYQTDYPTITLPRLMDHTEHFIRVLATKSAMWEYEKEYRLVRVPPNYAIKLKDYGLAWDGQKMQFPKAALCGITVGALMSDEFLSKVRKIVEEAGNSIPIWKADLHADQFKLRFSRAAPASGAGS